MEEIPSVHFSVQQKLSGDVEERLRRLEMAVEELKTIVVRNRASISNNNNTKNKCSGRDLNPGHGIESPV